MADLPNSAVDSWAVEGSWRSLNSTNVQACRYLYDLHILEVEFDFGRYYQYLNVPTDVAKGLYLTDSPGWYINHVMKSYSFVNLPGLA